MNPEEIEKRAEDARRLHKEGCNCCQSVVLAYEDLLPIDRESALRMSSAFGRGISGLREVCGCVSGIAMVCGLMDDAASVKMLAEEFRAENGDVNCGRLLAMGPQRSSCTDRVASAARILARHIAQD